MEIAPRARFRRRWMLALFALAIAGWLAFEWRMNREVCVEIELETRWPAAMGPKEKARRLGIENPIDLDGPTFFAVGGRGANDTYVISAKVQGRWLTRFTKTCKRRERSVALAKLTSEVVAVIQRNPDVQFGEIETMIDEVD